MALQLPALKSIGESIGCDFSAALPTAADPDGRPRRGRDAARQMTAAARRGGLIQAKGARVAYISRRDLLTAAGSTAVAAGFRPLRLSRRAAPIKLGSDPGQLRQPRHLRQADGDGDRDGGRGAQRRRRPARPQDRARSSTTASRTSRSTPSSPSSWRATDKVDVVHGGITSASREAIRQTFRRANTLYFYNVLYEGGVCDRNCVGHRHDAGAGGRAGGRLRHEAVGQQGLHPRRRLQLRPDHRQVGRSTMSSSARAASRRPTSSRSTSRTSARPSPRSRTRRRTSWCRRWSAARTCRSSGSGPPRA